MLTTHSLCVSRRGKQLFINISNLKSKSCDGSQHWLLAIDDVTDLSFSLFLKLEDQMANMMILLIKDLCETKNIVVKKIRCDNSGENIAFQQAKKARRFGPQL